MRMSKELFLRLALISRNQYPNEACGILLGNSETSRVDTVCEPRNIFKTADEFEIDSLAYLKIEKCAEKNGKDVVGIFHSHPDAAAVPSEMDKQYMIPGLNYFISSVDCTGMKQLKAYTRKATDGEVIELEYKVG